MRTTKEQNTKYQTQKTNNGITLIALIITIIVMLILVAVTVTMAVNGGIFGYAQNAAGQTNEKMEDEQELGNGKIKIGNNEYDSPQQFVNEFTGGVTTGNDGDGNLTLTINGESEVGVARNITLTLKNSNGKTISKNITWTSSNETAATVSNGVVTGLKAARENENASVGKTTITATYNGKTATKEITVCPTSCCRRFEPQCTNGCCFASDANYLEVDVDGTKWFAAIKDSRRLRGNS